MAVMTGFVKKVIYHNPETNYTVASIEGEGDYTAVFHDICAEGEKLTLIGKWITHKRYGKQFHADNIERNLKDMTCKEISIYIQSIKGIGPSRSEKIVSEYKRKTLDIMREQPEKLKDIGIPDSVINNIKEEFKANEVILKLKQKLIPLGLTSNMIRKLYKQYKEKTMVQLEENPYKLADDVHGIGFKKADSIAIKLGIDPESDFRIKACMKYILQQKAALGHTYLPFMDIIRELRTELQQFIPQDKIKHNIASNEHVINDGGNIYLRYIFNYEHEIGKKLNELNNKPLPTVQSDERVITEIQKNNKVKYTKKQQIAIKNTFRRPVSVITGGPGTGKTTIVKAIIAIAEKNKISVALAAPTGKAAKRMEEATGREAKTIHRLLEFKPSNNDSASPMYFQRNKNFPLDEDLIIIDESSMLDTNIMYHLIMAVNTRIVFIGDVSQLPSIGPGTVLADLIKTLPTTRLDAIFRQKETSMIIVNSQKINFGEFPIFNKTDFIFEEYTCPEQIADIYTKESMTASTDEIQILTPMKKTDAGTMLLNQLIQGRINPPAHNKKEIRLMDNRVLRLNDKVIQLRNNYDKECFNGDIGTIKAIEKGEGSNSILIKFDEREVLFTEEEVRKDMELAYALTIHKSQGSEFKTVIIPLITSHYIMLKRNLIYTAVTRARSKVIIIGQKKAVGISVNTIDATKRYTSLSRRIREHQKTQLSLL